MIEEIEKLIKLTKVQCFVKKCYYNEKKKMFMIKTRGLVDSGEFDRLIRIYTGYSYIINFEDNEIDFFELQEINNIDKKIEIILKVLEKYEIIDNIKLLKKVRKKEIITMIEFCKIIEIMKQQGLCFQPTIETIKILK